MEFEKDNIGKVLLLKDGSTFVIVGFDAISESYLARDIKTSNKNYWRIFEEIDKAIDFVEVIENLDDKICELERVDEIISKKNKELYYEHSDLDIDKIFRRLKECYNNALCVKMYSEGKGFSERQHELYKREFLNNEKGLRRALKRLYSVFEEDEYYTLIDYLIINKYRISQNEINIKINRYKSKKAEFINGYNSLLKELKTSRY